MLHIIFMYETGEMNLDKYEHNHCVATDVDTASRYFHYVIIGNVPTPSQLLTD